MLAIIERLAAERYQYVAGASLIHPSVALTAAHVVASRARHSLIVRAGEWNIKSAAERPPHQDRAVSQLIIHRQFDDRTLANDVALLLLAQPFVRAANVNSVCVPPANAFTAAARRCVAAGWGRDRLGPRGHYHAVMRKTDLSIVAHGECQSRLRNTHLGRNFRLRRGVLCASGEGGRNTCKGDGGAPLICAVPTTSSERRPPRYYQAGITIGGIGCGSSAPGLYTDVAYYSDWIARQIFAAHLYVDADDSISILDFFRDHDY